MDTHHVTFTEEQQGLRLDKALSDSLPDFSRARLTSIIREEGVLLDGELCMEPKQKIRAGQTVDVIVPDAVEGAPEPEDIPLDIVYEDEDLLVINKPAGLVVHPGAGNWTGTLVNALLHHCGNDLSGIGGVIRPGIVHRLDKDTSGLMLVAKNDMAHQALSAQLQDRSLSRTYHALVLGAPMPPKGEVDAPIGRHAQNRQKMAITARGREAKTFYKVLEEYGEFLALLECKLESGRTHQIRVHMAHLGFPLIGDPLYGPQATAVQKALKLLRIEEQKKEFILNFPRQILHAFALKFIHPRTEKQHSYEINPPEDMSKVLKLLKNKN